VSQELHLNFLSGAINGHFYWVYLVPISMCLGIIEKNTENITSTIGTYSTLKIALICLHNRKYYNFTPVTLELISNYLPIYHQTVRRHFSQVLSDFRKNDTADTVEKSLLWQNGPGQGFTRDRIGPRTDP
jgi:hypothetical protein